MNHIVCWLNAFSCVRSLFRFCFVCTRGSIGLRATVSIACVYLSRLWVSGRRIEITSDKRETLECGTEREKSLRASSRAIPLVFQCQINECQHHHQYRIRNNGQKFFNRFKFFAIAIDFFLSCFTRFSDKIKTWLKVFFSVSHFHPHQFFRLFSMPRRIWLGSPSVFHSFWWYFLRFSFSYSTSSFPLFPRMLTYKTANGNCIFENKLTLVGGAASKSSTKKVHKCDQRREREKKESALPKPNSHAHHSFAHTTPNEEKSFGIEKLPMSINLSKFLTFEISKICAPFHNGFYSFGTNE